MKLRYFDTTEVIEKYQANNLKPIFESYGELEKGRVHPLALMAYESMKEWGNKDNYLTLQDAVGDLEEDVSRYFPRYFDLPSDYCVNNYCDGFTEGLKRNKYTDAEILKYVMNASFPMPKSELEAIVEKKYIDSWMLFAQGVDEGLLMRVELDKHHLTTPKS